MDPSETERLNRICALDFAVRVRDANSATMQADLLENARTYFAFLQGDLDGK